MTNKDDGHSPVKIMFRLLQCLHHLSMLSEGGAGIASKAFRQKSEDLTNFIRPAIPTSGIKNEIKRINESWANNITLALAQHYSDQIDFLKGSLKAWNLSPFDCSLAKSKSLDWAKRHFGKRLKSEVLTKFEKLVKETLAPPKCKTPNHTTPTRRWSGPAPTPSGVPSRPSPRRPAGHTSTRTDPDKRRNSAPTSYVNAAKSPPSRPSLSKSTRPTKITKFPSLGHKKHNLAEMLKMWEIPKISKDILMIGTSNFARIPWVERNDCHILSYPGMKLYNLLKLFEGFRHGISSPNPGRKPSKILISCGLNDRNLSPHTNETNIKKIVNAVRKQFPGSEIYLAEISYSDKLTSKEKETIKSLNSAIRTLGTKDGIKSIPPIASSKFKVESDNIHWTENCAKGHLDHFFRHLN